MIDFSKLDKSVDLKGLINDVVQANSGDGTYEDVPYGTYEAKITLMELKNSKKGDPMLAIRFMILDGKYKGQLLFYNQVITLGFQIHLVNEFLRSLETEQEIEFNSYCDYGQLVNDIYQDVQGLEFELKTSDNKGFTKFEIMEIFEN